MSLIEIELVWVKVLCKMAESKMAEFKMAAIIKLSQNEWVKFLSANGGNQWMSEVSFVQIVGREVWVKSFCANGGN